MIGVDLTVWWAPFLAFAAGVVSFASPCVLPLVPGYLAFVSGMQSARDPASRGVAARTSAVPVLLFIAGFATVFTALGAFAGALAPVIRSPIGQRIAGLDVLAAGVLLIMQGKRMGGAWLYAENRPFLARIKPGTATAYPLGMAFAVGWTPCIGPVLAGTLALASAQGNAVRASLLLLAYSIGLGLPFLLIGVAAGWLAGSMDVIRRHHDAISAVSGVVMVTIGLLLVTGVWVRLLSPFLRLVNRFEPPI
jgi:cytochrome c-type biogenesis protein